MKLNRLKVRYGQKIDNFSIIRHNPNIMLSGNTAKVIGEGVKDMIYYSWLPSNKRTHAI